MAREADTPPVVGWVSTEMYGTRAADNSARAALVLAICISENRFSCMRAPPLAEKQIKGARSVRLWRAARANFSPTTAPMEPAMKRKSNAAVTTGKCLSKPFITSRASFSPVAFWAWVRRSLYFLLSRNLSASTGSTPANSSTALSGSRKWASRRRGSMGR